MKYRQLHRWIVYLFVIYCVYQFIHVPYQLYKKHKIFFLGFKHPVTAMVQELEPFASKIPMNEDFVYLPIYSEIPGDVDSTEGSVVEYAFVPRHINNQSSDYTYLLIRKWKPADDPSIRLPIGFEIIATSENFVLSKKVQK